MSYTEFSVTYIHNKFGGVNSVVVPANRVVLDENGLTTEHLFKSENQMFNFDIYWEEYMVGGEVCIPGEGNYCCVKGKFFHLEKTKSAGFIDGQESFFYTLIYDDGQNDGLTNNIHLCGTINLTGDKELVKQHLVQTTPLINNVNNYKYLNGRKTKHDGITIKLPDDDKIKKGVRPAQLSSYDYLVINDELGKLNLGEPDRDKLVIPFLYRTTPKYDGKGLIIKSIKSLEKKRLGIYDVDQHNELRRTLEVKFNTNELYTISTRENKVFKYAKSLTEAKFIEEIDLSGFTDLVQLSPISLTPLYDSPESIPKFSLRKLCEKLATRFSGERTLIPQMEEVITRVFSEGLGDLINREIDTNYKKIFRNVTAVSIKRDILGVDSETNVEKRNPEGFSRFDSLIPNHKFYRNFIFSQDSLRDSDLKMITGTANPYDEIKDKLKEHFDLTTTRKDFFNQGLEGTLSHESSEETKPTSTFNKGINKYISRGRNYDVLQTINFGTYISAHKANPEDRTGTYIETSPFKVTTLCKSKGLQLVLPIHSYKLVEIGQEESNDLDFTRTDGYDHFCLLLLPDYDRKTHVLSINNPCNKELYKDFSFIFDTHDQDNPLRGKSIMPFITTELFDIDENTTSTNEKRKNLLGEWIKERPNISRYGLNPVSSLYHLVNGTYCIKYKTYSSRCKGTNACEYTEYRSNDDEHPRLSRSGLSKFHLAKYRREGEGLRYQVEMTLPYSEDLIMLLRRYSTFHEAILAGKVVNNTNEKGSNHPNPLIGKDGRIQRMDSDDMSKLGSKDVVAVGFNPWLDEKWLTEIYKDSVGFVDLGSIGMDFSMGLVTDFMNSIVKRFFINDTKYGPNTTETESVVIPLRIYNDTALNDQLRSDEGFPELSTGMVRPYEGFNYLLYYRFTPTFDENRFGFSDSYQPFKFDGKDYFVMVIPNDGDNSKVSIPTYTYREPITNLSRESNIAYLVNGGGYDNNDKNRLRYGGGGFSNNHKKAGGYDADVMNGRMKYGVDKPNIFFEEFIKKDFKTDRTDNPKSFKNRYRYQTNVPTDLIISSLDDEIPSFMVKYLDPDSTLCQTLHKGTTSRATTNVDKLKELREKMIETINGMKLILSTQNTGFALEGTDGFASVKLNIEGVVTGDFELFTDKPNLIKSSETTIGKFENHNETDVDVIINTSNEINLYGKRIMQKSRYTSEGAELDLSLRVTPLPDPKQTLTSSGLKVEMKTDDQDLIRDIIEVPKEQVKSIQMSDYERERVFRDMELKTTERESEAQLLELGRERFKVKDSYEQKENARDATRKMATATVDMAVGVAKSFTLNPFTWTKSIEGAEAMAKGAINFADAAGEAGNRETDRKARFALGIQEFDVKAARMQMQHETNRVNAMERIGQLSSKIQYPQMNNGLIYKQFNESEGLSNVYITHYYPSGKLLKYIKEYYKEYGYEVLVRDFTCHGVESIKRHLRYINVFRNEHPNNRIKTMIESRALNGIFVSEAEIFG